MISPHGAVVGATEGSEIATAAAALAVGIGFVVLGVNAWRGKVGRDIPRQVLWAGPGSLVVGGTGCAIYGGVLAIREALDRGPNWWLYRVSNVLTVVLLVAAVLYAFLNHASWFPDRLLPPHHRRDRQPSIGESRPGVE